MTIAFTVPPGVAPVFISFGGLVKAMVIAASVAIKHPSPCAAGGMGI